MPRTRRLLPLVVVLLLAAPAPWAGGEEGGARLVVEDLDRREDGVYLYAFGTAAQEQELDTVLTVRNAGDATLTGLRAVGDCGCYGVTLSRSSLAPGEAARVGVKFRTLMMSGVLTKRLRLYHDAAPGHPTTIRLRVDIVAGVVIEPHRFYFENVLVGSKPSASVVAKWHEGVGRPFRVTGVEVAEHDIRVETSPFEEDGWKGTRIELAFESPPPLGMVSGTALVTTDHPEHPRITLAFTANVTGRVLIQSRVAYLGWVPRGTPRRVALHVRPYDDTVELGEVEAASRRGAVDVSVRRMPPGPQKGWVVEIAVPEDADVGRLDDVVEVRTAVPGEEVTEIEVRGEVIPHGE